MERIFNNGSRPTGVLSNIDASGDPDYNSALIKAMIADAVDYEQSYLAPNREVAQRYYYGLEPSLSQPDREPIFGDPPSDDYDSSGRSTIVSTDVRDTILSIMPSLMRIFAASEHAVEYQANTAADVPMAKQATDYIRYKLWEDNEGFLKLYSVFKDALTLRLGIMTWWSDRSVEIAEQSFSGISWQQINSILAEGESSEAHVVDMGQPRPDGLYDGVIIRYKKSRPQLRIETVPPEEFRISRNARSIHTADLIGREEFVRASELIARGFDRDVVEMFVGADPLYYSDERFMRNPGDNTFDVIGDLVQYGKYLIRYDSDGDGIDELHCVHTFGDDFEVVDDYIVSDVNYAVFGPDPTPHTVIGESLTDIVMDLQRIKTNLMRGSLDSLAQSIFPRTGINEMMTNVEDALNDDLGAVIRTRGDPSSAIFPIVIPFVGQQAFEMTDRIDAMRQSRTGISEASKGVDPKALQSTTVSGVDAIVTGAQERIELIARILAETGMKQLYRGLLTEVINNPNPPEEIMVNGEFITVDPSLFDPTMRVRPNPMLGKGSDVTRLAVLGNVLTQQQGIIAQYGLGNGVVGIQEVYNTLTDMLAINNIRNINRYFKQLTPQQIQQMESAPKEPTPEMLTAQAMFEKNKTDGAVALGKQQENTVKQAHQIVNDNEQLKWEKEKTAIEAFISLATIAKDAANVADEAVTQYVEPREQ